MALDVKSLLAKNSITGDEFGRSFLLNNIALHRTGIPLFTEDIQQKLGLMLRTPDDAEVYRCYITFHTWLHRYSSVTQSYCIQAINALENISYILDKTLYSEELIAKKNNNHQIDSIIQSLSVFYQCDINPISFERINYLVHIFKERLHDVQCYNSAVDLFAEFLDLPDLRLIFTGHITVVEDGIDSFTDAIKHLKCILTGSKEERKKKKDMIKILFPNFKICDFTPTKAAISKARHLLPDLFKSHNPYSVIKILKET